MSAIPGSKRRWSWNSWPWREQRLWEDLTPWLAGALVTIGMAIWEWLASVWHWPRQPWLYTVFAVVSVAAAVVRRWQLRVRARHSKASGDEQREVREFLEKLRSSAGADIYHDVPGDGFDIDHVILCRKGFFAIETRTRSRPIGRDAKITLTKDGLLFDSQPPDRESIRGAQTNALWLSRFLEQSTGQEFTVRGVVLFPGWYVETMDPVWRTDLRQPWVLEPKALPATIAREPLRFTEDEVKLAAYQLSRYVRIVVPADEAQQVESYR